MFCHLKSLRFGSAALSVICDVSCDTTNPHSESTQETFNSPCPLLINPVRSHPYLQVRGLQIHRFACKTDESSTNMSLSINTTFTAPTVPVPVSSDPPLSVISIDHLPSLLPKEASEAFSNALLPSLLQLKDRKSARVWQQAEELFHKKVATLPAGIVDGKS